ncbi:hypothetical protein [Rhizobium laguerreae]|uniref:hypothetical protein n=1 Tax=Rhizobium laguerreae TaxID=1076926 RepID=UPI001C908202|nr:hypothetical protein [Rhizobium laguerreae]MBY3434858.1 hypothetical protein [Rhizobium laguerreae]MBY3449001.1 hypothetical protein [Rhizobium laguerreae]MBY3456775.1 hypothetical protein [Rhizobium laguerreae]
MKIISTDNFARESVADTLIAENVHDYYAKEITEFLQAKYGGENASRYYKAVADDHPLWGGMAEFV